MKPFYQNLLAKYGLDKQNYPTHLKTIPPTTLKLNYESINNNAARGRDAHCFDYCVKDEVLLAKLAMKPFMAHFNAFDSSFDALAALAVLCSVPPFSSAAPSAELVRSEVRNEWARLRLCVMDGGEIQYMFWSKGDLGWRSEICPSRKKQSSSLSYSCGGSMVRCRYTYLKKYCFVFPSSRGGLNQNCILRPIEYAGCWRDTDWNLNVDIHEPNWRHKFEKNRQIFI